MFTGKQTQRRQKIKSIKPARLVQRCNSRPKPTRMESSSEDDSNHLAADQKSQRTKSKMCCVLMIFLKKGAFVFLGYIICYMGWSILLPILIGSLIWLEHSQEKQRKKISNKFRASNLNKKELQEVLKGLPPWVTFPDYERADWLNEIIVQLWPSLGNYLIKVFRGSIQKKITKKYESFKFEDIDFGETPPKIDGVKTYQKSITKDAIIIDFDILYDGDCDIQCSMSGAEIGRIKDFQLSVEIRLILKPLLMKKPFVGGMQIFFLNTPEINFDLEGITAFPGLSYFIRQKIEEQITKHLVFPNQMTKRFSKTIEAAELKALEPEGVLRVHVFEAKDLVKKDVTGKSDPYAILNLGAQSYTTDVITKSLNPKWDNWCEFVVLDPRAQFVYFKLYDKDFNEDDFLGSGAVEISKVIKGETDQWFELENVKHGKLHLRFTWLSLSAEYASLDIVAAETKSLEVKDLSTAILGVFVDSVEELPRTKSYKKPDPYFILTVGNKQQKSRVKRHTTDPIWEQGFFMLVPSPNTDSLTLTIYDKHSDTKLLNFSYIIKDLAAKPNLLISKEEFIIPSEGYKSKLILSLQLRILTSENSYFDDDLSDSDSDYDEKHSEKSSAEVSRQISVEEAFEASKFTEVQSTYISVLGQLEVTLKYNKPRQKLLVEINQMRQLPLKDPKDIPDPYVKVKLNPSDGTKEHKTQVKIDNCDPVFNEMFDYLVNSSELVNRQLIFTIKTKKFFSNKNVIGQVIIDLKHYPNLDEREHRAWYNIEPKMND